MAEYVERVVQRVRQRLLRPGSSRQADDSWLATFVLLGMRYPTAVAQAIVAEGIKKGEAQGQLKEAQTMLLLAGTRRFGPTSEAARAAVEAITDPALLEGLMERLFDVNGWSALVAGLPRPPRRRGNGTQQPAGG